MSPLGERNLVFLFCICFNCLIIYVYTKTGTRKKYIIHPDLCKTAYVNSSCPVFQVRSLVWGQLSQHHGAEVSRTKADIASQRGGPVTVSVVQLYELQQQGKLIYCCW